MLPPPIFSSPPGQPSVDLDVDWNQAWNEEHDMATCAIHQQTIRGGWGTPPAKINRGRNIHKVKDESRNPKDDVDAQGHVRVHGNDRNAVERSDSVRRRCMDR